MEPNQVAVALETNRALTKQAALKPSWQDLKSELGVQKVEHEDGTCTAKFTGTGKDMLRLHEMYKSYHMSKADRAAEIQGKDKTLPMLDAQGRVRHVREQDEDQSAAKHGSRRLRLPGRRQADWSEGHIMLRDGEVRQYVSGQWVPVE